MGRADASPGSMKARPGPVRGVRAVLAAVSIAILLAPASGLAQGASDYPSRPIRFIVPYTPGGLGDTFARALAQDLASKLGQPVMVENRPGASQAIGAEAAARSAPDGYTLFMGTQSGLVLNAIARKKLPFDPVRDFAPVSQLFTSPLYLVVHPTVPAHSLGELIALAKREPGKLTYASIGTGSSIHLAGEMLKTRAGIDLVHVPYKGSAPAIADLLSGQTQLMFEGGTSALPHVRSGKLRALATTGAKRTDAMPDLPTMIEAGLPDFDVTVWFGLVAPAGVPQPIIARLNREVVGMLRSPATREKFAPTGIELTPSTPEELGERIRVDLPRWTRVMRDAGIQPE